MSLVLAFDCAVSGLGIAIVGDGTRLAGIAEGLARCGVRVTVEGDDLIVEGADNFPAGGAMIETQLDHRIAMAFLVLGLAANQPVRIDDGRPIATSFPDFVPLMTRLGATFTEAR